MDTGDLLEEAAAATARLQSAASTTSRIETYLKKGRSRTFSLEPAASVVHSDELGWAVRVHAEREAGFGCGSGTPRMPALSAGAAPLALPTLEETQARVSLPPVRDLDAPLLSEGEGLAWLRSVAERLKDELPGARLLRGVLEDGASLGVVASSEGVTASYRHRVATLKLEAVGADPQYGGVFLAASARSARSFVASSVARRLADRLAIAESGISPEASTCRAVLSPEVAAAVLESLAPIFVGPEHWSIARSLAGSEARWGVSELSLIDDPHLTEGLLPQARDGEGVPTQRTVLVDRGRLRQPILGRGDEEFAEVDGLPLSGCRYRHSYRALPEASPSHLFLRHERAASVSQLVGELGGGYYFIDVTGPVRRHFSEGWLEVPVCGFQVRGQRATAQVRGARLRLDLRHVFHSILGAGRDLRFRPRRGCIGSPSLLVEGVEVAPG
ncbi:MAG: metallopeptidase TldD-related protein [Acidobacteriota bacterium]